MLIIPRDEGNDIIVLDENGEILVKIALMETRRPHGGRRSARIGVETSNKHKIIRGEDLTYGQLRRFNEKLCEEKRDRDQTRDCVTSGGSTEAHPVPRNANVCTEVENESKHLAP